MSLSIIFWLLLFIAWYTYVGYGILLYLIIGRHGRPAPPPCIPKDRLPPITIVMAAYNEATFIVQKIQNCLALDYPKHLITYFIVTDGSDDGTAKIVQTYASTNANLTHFHQTERKGKINAVQRVMTLVRTPITIFSDANTLVNPQALKKLVRHFTDPEIGAVAGEKRIKMDQKDEASAAGEGFYWKYESALKRWDAQLYSVVGAAGELFAIRTHLFEPVPNDTIIEDFYLTLRIAQRDFRVAYEANAYAVETASVSVQEELKRKIRIAAGGLQSISRLKDLLNPLKYGILSFQYISHRVLRWTIAPIALPFILLLNLALIYFSDMAIYRILLALQMLFYLAAIVGWFLEKRKLKFKVFFIPYYFCMMNYAVYMGFFRIISGKQTVLWERAKRA